jgi:hypothetical protein
LIGSVEVQADKRFKVLDVFGNLFLPPLLILGLKEVIDFSCDSLQFLCNLLLLGLAVIDDLPDSHVRIREMILNHLLESLHVLHHSGSSFQRVLQVGSLELALVLCTHQLFNQSHSVFFHRNNFFKVNFFYHRVLIMELNQSLSAAESFLV